MIIVNFKTVASATGPNAIKLAKIHEKVSKETGVTIIVAVQATDIYAISQSVSIPVYAQHCDAIGYGSHTGWILPEALKAAGAKGTLINHSEHRLKSETDVATTVARAKELGLETVICAESDSEGAKLDKLCKPTWLAIEPPELIGGDISVSTAQPDLIQKAVEAIGNNVLVGAGIKNSQDISIAIKLGAKGVLLASGVTKADDPEKVLNDLASAFLSLKLGS
jgi:triosephosphate isomerase